MLLSKGADMIAWMLSNLDIKASDEALHLANMLCRYVYFFQVTGSSNTSVKEDGELYRFQVILESGCRGGAG